MNTTTEGFREDLKKDPKQLEREADRAREHMEGTLSALERRTSPGELFDQAMGYLKRDGGDFGRTLVEQVRDNPLPVLLIGAGITWLAVGSKTSLRADHYRPNDYHDAEAEGLIGYVDADGNAGGENGGLGDKAARAAGSAKRAVGDAKSSARDAMHRAGDAAQSTADRVSDGARRARRGAHDAGARIARSTRSGGQRVQDGYRYLSQEQPLVLGALAIAAGAAIGAVIPATEAEDRWVGERSDEAKERVKDEGQHQAEKAKASAVKAVEGATDNLKAKTSDDAARQV